MEYLYIGTYFRSSHARTKDNLANLYLSTSLARGLCIQTSFRKTTIFKQELCKMSNLESALLKTFTGLKYNQFTAY